MKRINRSHQQIIDDCNNLLMQFNQRIRIVELKKRFVKLNTGRTLEGNESIVFLRRIENKIHTLYLENFDKIYIDGNTDIIKEIKAVGSRRGGKACQQLHSDKIRSNLNTGIPWNKGTTGLMPSPWQAGQSKHTDPRLKKLSEDRSGKGNPMYGHRYSDEDKQAKSEYMKQRILNGTFTPNTNNRRTHYDIIFNGVKYRSSWELVYHISNPDDQYERLRIPYTFKNKDYIYIVDFINYAKMTVTEVRPLEMCNDDRTIAKISALKEWCKLNQFSFCLYTQTEVKQALLSIDMAILPDSAVRKLKGLR